MRIWDINPGYLNNEKIIEEINDIKKIISAIATKRHSMNDEINRWTNNIWGLNNRAKLLQEESKIRKINKIEIDLLPFNDQFHTNTYIDYPYKQYQILQNEITHNTYSRIPIPLSAQHLWSHHKYSVMSRDINEYKKIGNTVSTMKPKDGYKELALTLSQLLKIKPSEGGIRNALQHMWGYFNKSSIQSANIDSICLLDLLKIIQKLAYQQNKLYIIHSTALSDLAIWIK